MCLFVYVIVVVALCLLCRVMLSSGTAGRPRQRALNNSCW